MFKFKLQSLLYRRKLKVQLLSISVLIIRLYRYYFNAIKEYRIVKGLEKYTKYVRLNCVYNLGFLNTERW